jgi:hypothetical protein
VTISGASRLRARKDAGYFLCDREHRIGGSIHETRGGRTCVALDSVTYVAGREPRSDRYGMQIRRMRTGEAAYCGRPPGWTRAAYSSHSSANLGRPVDRSTEWDVPLPSDRRATPRGSAGGSRWIHGHDHHERHAWLRGEACRSTSIHDHDHQGGPRDHVDADADPDGSMSVTTKAGKGQRPLQSLSPRR